MPGYQSLEFGAWAELAAVLAVGVPVIVGLAAVSDRLIGASVWRRTVWQVATLALLVLVSMELTGAGSALVASWRSRAVAQVDSAATAEADSALNAQPRHGTFGTSSTLSQEMVADGEVPVTEPRSQQPAPWLLPGSREKQPSDMSHPFSPDWPPVVHDAADAQGFRPHDLPGSFEHPFEQQDGKRVDAHNQGSSGRTASKTPATRKRTRQMPSSESQDNSAAEQATQWLSVAAGGYGPGMVWLLGTALLTAWVVFARTLLWRFRRRHARICDETMIRRVRTLAGTLGIRRTVSVVESARLETPVAFGGLQPTIGVPAGFSRRFNRSQQQAMLAHELAHLAAGDPTWQLLSDLSCAALWWHPLVWWSRRQLRFASETAADEASLLVPDGPEVLAGCLVGAARRLSGRRQLQWLAVDGPAFRSTLGRRVERLLSLPRRAWQVPNRRRLALTKTLFPTVLVLLAVLCTAWVRPQASLAKGETTMNALNMSWRRSLAATALITLIGAVPNDVVADKPQTDNPKPVVVGDQPTDDDPARLAARDAERHHPEARRREARERRRMEELEEIEREIHELEEEAEEIERELGDRTPDQAPELHGELEEIHERLEDLRRELEHGEWRHPEEREREDRKRRRMEELEEIEREIHELEEEAEEIERELGDRTPDEAPELHEELTEIHEQIEGLRRELHHHAVDMPPHAPKIGRGLGGLAFRVNQLNRQRRELAARAHSIRQKLGRLDDQDSEEAQRLRATLRRIDRETDFVESELQKLRRALSQGGGPPTHDRPVPMPGRQVYPDKRIRHLSAAIDNLRAAGMHDMAEQLQRKLDRALEEHPRRRPDSDAPPRRPGHDLPPRGRPDDTPRGTPGGGMGAPPAGGGLPGTASGPPRHDGVPLEYHNRVIEQLHGQIHQLRREMNELRALVEDALDED